MTSKTDTDLTSLLRKYWNYDNFRGDQATIIKSVLEEKDVLALMPTGGGKSICFQVPSLILEGVTLVISPLIALMLDQVQALKKRNIKADAIYSGLHYKEIDRIIDNARFGDTKLLYLSPERLKSIHALERIKTLNIGLIAVDEAHCISEWGYDFRPAYLDISKLREFFPKTPIIALTASATPQVADDIKEKLEFRPNNSKEFRASFARPNISFHSEYCHTKEPRLLSLVKELRPNDSAILYVRNRRKTSKYSEFLKFRGFSVDFYHAGLDSSVRAKKQEAWIKGQTQIIVCTNAFGMGIDKPNVSLVVHLDLPTSIEDYYQEAGRAGRDGRSSSAYLLWSQGDKERLEDSVAIKYPKRELIIKAYTNLCQHFNLNFGQGKEKSFPLNMNSAARHYNGSLLEFYHSIKWLEKSELLSLKHLNSELDRIHIFNPSQAQRSLKNDELSIVKNIFRLHEAVHLYPVRLRTDLLSKWVNLPIEKCRQILRSLHEKGYVQYFEHRSDTEVVFLEERLRPENIRLDMVLFKRLKEMDLNRMKSLFNYLDDKECLHNKILKYFGESPVETCGKCGNCLATNLPKMDTMKILATQLGDGEKKLELILKEIRLEQREAFISEVKRLIDDSKLSYTNGKLALIDEK